LGQNDFICFLSIVASYLLGFSRAVDLEDHKVTSTVPQHIACNGASMQRAVFDIPSCTAPKQMLLM